MKDRKAFDEAVGKLPDGAYVLSVEDEKEYRSGQANRFHWGVVVKQLCDHLQGHTPEEMHEILKYKFNRRTTHDPQTGEVIEVNMPTHTMTREEWNTFEDNCIRWAAELGCYIQTSERYI